jgi:hypothetical protein
VTFHEETDQTRALTPLPAYLPKIVVRIRALSPASRTGSWSEGSRVEVRHPDTDPQCIRSQAFAFR